MPPLSSIWAPPPSPTPTPHASTASSNTARSTAAGPSATAAPSTAPARDPAANDSTAAPPRKDGADTLRKLHRLHARLHWKANLLALSRAHAARVREAGMFALDFFEFYALLERALVLLLAACGVRVSASFEPLPLPPLRSRSSTPPVGSGPSAGDGAAAAANDSAPLGSRGPAPTTATPGSKDAVDDGGQRAEKIEFIFATRGRTTIERPIVPARAAASTARVAVGDALAEHEREKGAAGKWGGRDRAREHAFHENVLRALDRPECALHACLGRGGVRAALGRAKELRNRFKDVALGSGLEVGVEGRGQSAGEEMMGIGETELQGLLGVVLAGVGEGLGVVERAGAGVAVVVGRDGGVEGGGWVDGQDDGDLRMEVEMEDGGAAGMWEVVGDAMEWE